MRAEVEVWWRQSQADLVTAQLLRNAGRYYAASWFAQQAAEKGLKSLFLEQAAKLAPRTHDLEYLGSELDVPPNVQQTLALLNPAFDMARYPDPVGGTAPIDQVSEGIAAGHVGAAEAVLEWLQTQLT